MRPTTGEPKLDEPREPKPKTAEGEQPKRPGPGRPPKSVNAPKAGAEQVARAQRKAPTEIKDTKAWLTSTAENARKVCERHNQLHPGDPYHVRIVAGERPAQMSPEQCAALAAVGVTKLAAHWHVDPVVNPADLQQWGAAASELSKYLPEVAPLHMAIIALAMSTIALISPLWAQKQGRPVASTGPLVSLAQAEPPLNVTPPPAPSAEPAP